MNLIYHAFVGILQIKFRFNLLEIADRGQCSMYKLAQQWPKSVMYAWCIIPRGLCDTSETMYLSDGLEHVGVKLQETPWSISKALVNSILHDKVNRICISIIRHQLAGIPYGYGVNSDGLVNWDLSWNFKSMRECQNVKKYCKGKMTNNKNKPRNMWWFLRHRIMWLHRTIQVYDCGWYSHRVPLGPCLRVRIILLNYKTLGIFQ